ncbi:hypothetical protein BGZ92_005849 [Podila epicladia]|nr:hypothetical protein BGZ92_005849 [Podila epicladia]
MYGSSAVIALTNDAPSTVGIAVGTALRNVKAVNEQDLMFMAGEKVVLLERLENGECMGLCEGVVGRFTEADVDFSIPGTTIAPAVPAKSRSRASSAASNSSDRKSRRPKSSALEEVPQAFSALARHTLLTAIAMDPHATERPGPRKLLSEENLKVISSGPIGRRQVLSSPPAPLQEHSSAPVIPPRSSSRQTAKSATNSTSTSPHLHPSGYIRQKTSSDKLSPGTASSASSITSTVELNASSATIITNSLEIKSNELSIPDLPQQRQQQDHQAQSRIVSKSSNNSLSSRGSSPNYVQGTPSRPITPILENFHDHHPSSNDQSQVVPPKSKARSQRPENEDHRLEKPSSLPSQEIGSNGHEDHYLSTMLEDIRSKTHHVLQKARFSMSPYAGLYADHGSKDLDLNVVQMPSSFPISTPDQKHQPTSSKVSVSTAAPPEMSGSSPASITFATPDMCECSSTNAPSVLSTKEDDPPEPTSPTSSTFRFDKLRPWVKAENRQRSNSGPARHSDSSILQKLEEDMATTKHSPNQQNQTNGTGEPRRRQRRVSEATAITMASASFGSPLTKVLSSESRDSNGKNNRPRTKIGWFGKSNRTSVQLVEDPRKPHPLGHGIEGGITHAHRLSMGIFSDYDEEEEDTDDGDDGDETEAEGRKSTDNSTANLYINDYGFIYDLEDESNQGQDLSGTGSAVSEWAKMSETDKKRAIRKQKYNRENEIKWVHAATRLHADNVKKSSKYKKLVRRGVPTSVRGRVWLFLAKADLYRQPGLFEELQKRGPLPIHEVIERDIHRCYPDHVHFRDGMGGTGQQDLHAILRAYAHYKPSVGYCQGMGRLVGMMLMQMPVEDAFWLLVATIEGYMQDYYTPTLRQLRIDAQVFDRLLKEQDPALSEHLEKNDVIPLMYMTQWFMTLFTMSLPWASVLRVWDVFYFDGVKALFRVGLAILQLCREHLLNKCPSSSELLAYILHIPLDILAPKQLLEATLQIRLKKQDVTKLITATAESMDQTEKEVSRKAKAKSVMAATSVTSTNGTQQQQGSTAASIHTLSSATSSNSKTNVTSTHTQEYQSSKDSKKHQSQPPMSSAKSSLSAADATPPIPAPSSGSSGFSPLKVFKPRKRSGTVHQ